jgi:hypothetical protein
MAATRTLIGEFLMSKRFTRRPLTAAVAVVLALHQSKIYADGTTATPPTTPSTTTSTDANTNAP